MLCLTASVSRKCPLHTVVPRVCRRDHVKDRRRWSPCLQSGHTGKLLADGGIGLMAAAAAGGRGRSGSSGPQTLNLLRPGSGSGGTTNLLQSTGSR